MGAIHNTDENENKSDMEGRELDDGQFNGKNRTTDTEQHMVTGAEEGG